jgi:hypothetical protein
MANRQQRRKLRSMKRKGQAPKGEVREHGEVELAVSVRDGAVVMTLVGPDGQTMVLGVPPEAARKFALAVDEAAESIEREVTPHERAKRSWEDWDEREVAEELKPLDEREGT